MPVLPPDSTLAAIQTKVRRLTRSPSQAQLTDTDLQNYINTFVVYDFPEHIRTYINRVTFKFWTNPYQDEYYTDTASYGSDAAVPPTSAQFNPLYDFQNKYLTVHGPLYIAGFQSFFSQSREQFFGIYPNVNSINSIGQTGDGVQTQFSGVIVNQAQQISPNLNQQGACLLKNNVLFDSVDINNNGLALRDSPILDSITGNPTQYGLMYTPNNPPVNLPLILTAPYNTDPNFPTTNFINYVTGQFTITFPIAPGSGLLINSQTVPQVVSLPQAMLFYDNKIILRPVPDQPYQVNFEAYIAPSYIMATNQSPQLKEYWQYIAYGAAKKIFEDRMDTDSVEAILPEYKKQETLVLRRTIVQYTNDRVATIYTEQTSFGPGSGAWGWGGGPF